MGAGAAGGASAADAFAARSAALAASCCACASTGCSTIHTSRAPPFAVTSPTTSATASPQAPVSTLTLTGVRPSVAWPVSTTHARAPSSARSSPSDTHTQPSAVIVSSRRPVPPRPAR